MNICWFTNIPSPYKTELFQYLGRNHSLLCVYEKRNEKGREDSWVSAIESVPFKAVFLSDLKKENIKKIAEEYDVLLNGDYSSTKVQVFISQFHKAHKPVIMQADGGLVIPRPLVDPFIRWTMNRNDYFLSSGQQTDAYYQYYRVPKDKLFHYRFSSLSEEDIIRHKEMIEKKNYYREKCGYKEKVVFFSVGQQIPRKGYDVLAKAMIGLDKEVGVYIAGGEPEENVNAIIQENRIMNIHFVGFKSKEELGEFYAGADCFVLPTRYDIWGLVINEALSFGLPVVSTDRCVAALEFAKKTSAVKLVKTNDSEELGQAMQDLAKKNHSYKEDALKAIQNYTIEQSAKDIMDALEATVANWKEKNS